MPASIANVAMGWAGPPGAPAIWPVPCLVDYATICLLSLRCQLADTGSSSGGGSIAAMTIYRAGRPTPDGARPAPRPVASVPAGARACVATARRGAARRARPLVRRVRRAPDHRPGARAPDPDGSAGRGGAAQQERRHAAHRPARQRRPGRAERLPRGRPRRRGRPHGRAASTGCAPRRGRTCAASASTSSR